MYCANKYSAVQMIGAILFLLFVVWAINKDWRRKDNLDRVFDDLDKEMKELEVMVKEFKKEIGEQGDDFSKGGDEGGMEEEAGIRRRKKVGKEKENIS